MYFRSFIVFVLLSVIAQTRPQDSPTETNDNSEIANANTNSQTSSTVPDNQQDSASLPEAPIRPDHSNQVPFPPKAFFPEYCPNADPNAHPPVPERRLTCCRVFFYSSQIFSEYDSGTGLNCWWFTNERPCSADSRYCCAQLHPTPENPGYAEGGDCVDTIRDPHLLPGHSDAPSVPVRNPELKKFLEQLERQMEKVPGEILR